MPRTPVFILIVAITLLCRPAMGVPETREVGAEEPWAETPPTYEEKLADVDWMTDPDAPFRRLRPTLREQLLVDAAAEEKLSHPISFATEGVRLDNVIEYFRKICKLNIIVYWNVLAEVGVQQDTPITLKMEEAPARDVLARVLHLAAAAPEADAPGGVAARVTEGFLEISTEADLDREGETRVYDVRDLLASAELGEETPTRLQEVLTAQLNLYPDPLAPPKQVTMQLLNGNLIVKTDAGSHAVILGVLMRLRSVTATRADSDQLQDFDLDQPLGCGDSGGSSD